jgi:hypothetical protein
LVLPFPYGYDKTFNQVKATTVSVRLRIICVRINTIVHSSAMLGMTT